MSVPEGTSALLQTPIYTDLRSTALSVQAWT